MSNFTDYIGGGGTTTALYNQWITTSQTWTPPYSGVVTIHCVGAGAGGSTGTHNNPFGGGGAGGYCKKELTVSTGTNWTMVVGSKGLGCLANDSSGGSGGNTSATDGTITLTANGGSAAVFASAGAGGTATGGDVNFTGGAGRNYGGGGGAVGTRGTGNAGVNGFSNYNQLSADSDCLGPYDPLAYGIMTGGGKGSLGAWGINVDSPNPAREPAGFLAGGGGSATVINKLIIPPSPATVGGGGGSLNAGTGVTIPTYGYSSASGGVGIILIQYKTIT